MKKMKEQFGGFQYSCGGQIMPLQRYDKEKILDACVNGKGVHLIDLAVDYSLNHSILNELLAKKQCLI